MEYIQTSLFSLMLEPWFLGLSDFGFPIFAFEPGIKLSQEPSTKEITSHGGLFARINLNYNGTVFLVQLTRIIFKNFSPVSKQSSGKVSLHKDLKAEKLYLKKLLTRYIFHAIIIKLL